jgi:hypothetical protein
MFHLHDKTRRKLAIAGFLLLGLLPTCAVAGWCLWRNMPWETQIAAERLQQQLGWKVKLERLKHPRPGTEVYENLEFLDPETDQSIFFCRSIEVSKKQIADPQGQEKPTLMLSFDQPEIDAAGLDQIGRLIERIVQDHVAPGLNCRLSPTELKLRGGKVVQIFPGIEARVIHSEGDIQAAMRSPLPRVNLEAFVEIQLHRDRKVSPPQSRFELVTTANEVSWEQIVSEIPEFTRLELKVGNKIRSEDGLWHLYFTSSVVR